MSVWHPGRLWYNPRPMTQTQTAISTIIFDIGNVILNFDYLRAAHRLADETGLSLDQVKEHFYFSTWERAYSRGEMSSEDFYAKIKKDLRLEMSFERFAAIWNDIFWLNEVTADVIQRLKGNYKLACISNTNDLHYRYWRESFKVLDLIEVFFPSHEVGLRKPSGEIFHLVIAKMKFDPKEALFIDDMPENVEAAKHAGFNAVLFKTSSIEKELKKAGVNL